MPKTQNKTRKAPKCSTKNKVCGLSCKPKRSLCKADRDRILALRKKKKAAGFRVNTPKDTIDRALRGRERFEARRKVVSGEVKLPKSSALNKAKTPTINDKLKSAVDKAKSIEALNKTKVVGKAPLEVKPKVEVKLSDDNKPKPFIKNNDSRDTVRRPKPTEPKPSDVVAPFSNNLGKQWVTRRAPRTEKDFEKQLDTIYDHLNKNGNMDDLVPVYRIRREMGTKMDREKFDEWLLNQQANDRYQLLESGVEDDAADKLGDSVETPLNGVRAYAKRLDKNSKADKPLEFAKTSGGIKPTKGNLGKEWVKRPTPNNEKDFEKDLDAIYDRLNKDGNMGDLVPIYRVRREMGINMNRDKFSEWLINQQANDRYQLLEGSVENSAPDKIEDSVTTPLNGIRGYMKRLK
jgi:predicted  nucleic acid-binding Zn ribbon protein